MEEKIITLDGKNYRLVPVEEEQKQDDMFSIKYGEGYYFRTVSNIARLDTWMDTPTDREKAEHCNTCKSKAYMEINCLETELHDKLRKFSHQHGWNNATWGKATSKNYIIYDTGDGEFRSSWARVTNTPGVVYFESKDAADEAIKDVVLPFCKDHPEYLAYLRGEDKGEN